MSPTLFPFPRRVITFVLLTLLFGVFSPGKTAYAAEIAWAKSLPEAMAQAQRSNRLVMVDFYTDWCGWCKKLDKDVFPHPTVVGAARQFVSVRLNAEREGVETARKYGVTGFPTILFLTPSGAVEGRIGGYSPATSFAATMNRTAKEYREFPLLKKKAKASPNDLPTIARVTEMSARRGETAEAQSGLASVRRLDPQNARGYLSKTLTAVGDMYASHNEVAQAASLFRQAAQVGRKSREIGYATYCLAITHLMRRDQNAAATELKALLSNPRVTEADKEPARRLLSRLQQG